MIIDHLYAVDPDLDEAIRIVLEASLDLNRIGLAPHDRLRRDIEITVVRIAGRRRFRRGRLSRERVLALDGQIVAAAHAIRPSHVERKHGVICGQSLGYRRTVVRMKLPDDFPRKIGIGQPGLHGNLVRNVDGRGWRIERAAGDLRSSAPVIRP